MAETETRWTKEWPTAKDSFHWMRWIDGRYRDLPVHVNGIQVMSLFDHSYQQRGNIEGQVEFLGPISPADFEQLTRLRNQAALFDELVSDLETRTCYGCNNRIGWNETPAKYGDWTKCASCRNARALLKRAAALREALAQRNTGGK